MQEEVEQTDMTKNYNGNKIRQVSFSGSLVFGKHELMNKALK